jgi:hypothetical protein
MRKTKDQKAAISKREKLALPADPMAATAQERIPREGTSEWHFYQYSQAYSRAMTMATGRPFTPPMVAGPKSVMVQLLITHCHDEEGGKHRGAAVIEWIENVVQDFRSSADEREYGYGNQGWAPSAFARWLDNGRPKANAPRPGANAAGRAHIAVKKG